MASFRFFDIYSSTVQAHVETDKDKASSKDMYKHVNPRTLDVYADLVLLFRYKQPIKGGISKPEYEQKTLTAYQEVLTNLTRVGLQYETRPSGNDALFIFILCPWAVLKREVTRNRYRTTHNCFFYTLDVVCSPPLFHTPSPSPLC